MKMNNNSNNIEHNDYGVDEEDVGEVFLNLEQDFEIVEENDIVPEEDYENELEEIDESVLTFIGHENSALCCAINNEGTLAATGGQDDKGYLWRIQTGEILMKSEGHKDSIDYVGFSSDGKYVAYGNIANNSEGVIQVYDVETRVIHHIIEDLSDLRWMQWHETKPIILAGLGTGDCILVDVSAKRQFYWNAGNYIACVKGTFLGNSSQAVVAFEDGSLQLWEGKQHACLFKLEGNGHEISTIAKSPDNTLIVTGDLNDTVNLYLIQSCQAKPIKKIHSWKCSDQEVHDENSNGIQCVLFSPDGRYICVALVTGLIFVFDKLTKAQRVLMRNETNLSKCIWDPSKPLLYVGNDGIGSVTVFNTNNGTLENEYKGPSTTIHDLCYNRNQNIILTACEDTACRIFCCK